MNLKKLVLITLLCFLFNFSSAQIKYYKGYYVSDSNQKTEGFIKNSDWEVYPESIFFKESEDGEIKEIAISNLNKFEIYGYTKYEKVVTEIDTSSDNLNYLTATKNPLWKKDTLMLKVLVAGKANLYIYKKKEIKRYFYSVDNKEIKQLVYKRYYFKPNQAASNTFYKQQLFMDVRCPDATLSSVESLEYLQSPLEKYFIKFNKCSGDTGTSFGTKGREYFHLRAIAGFNITSLAVSNALDTTKNVSFSKKSAFRFGLQFEFVLPYKMNKLGILFEPSYQSYSGEEQTSRGKVSIDLKSIEFPIGLRYYSFLTDNSKLFFNALYLPRLTSYSGSAFTIERIQTKLDDLKSKSSFSFGAGYEFKNISLEVRYYMNRNIFLNYIYWQSDYTALSINLGYKFINK